MLKSLATRTEAASQLVDRSTCSIRATSSSQLKPTQLPTQYSGFCGQFRVILSSPGLSSSIRYAITLIYEPKGRIFESCRAHRKATATSRGPAHAFVPVAPDSCRAAHFLVYSMND